MRVPHTHNVNEKMPADFNESTAKPDTSGNHICDAELLIQLFAVF